MTPEIVLQDMRFAFRKWRRRPGLAVMLVFVLALGIGLSGTIFSAAWGTLWRGMGRAGGDQLVRLAVAEPSQPAGKATMPPALFGEIRGRLGSCESLGAWLPFAVDVAGLDHYPERLNGAMVTAGTLEILGVRPLLGRFFNAEEEEQQAKVVVIGERLWRQQLGGDSSVLGRVLEVYRQPRTIIGVVAEGIRAPYNQELWYPYEAETALRSPWLQVFGRMSPGISLEQVRAELRPMASEHLGDGRLIVDGFETAYLEPALRRSLKLALLAVAALLLVACANAAGLLLAHGLDRRGEIAIRHALGARRGRVLRQLLTETSVLVAGAGVLGIAFARCGIWLYQKTAPVQGPYWIDVRLDPVVLAFTLGLTLLVGLVAGGLPAWQLTGRGQELRAGRGVATRRGTSSWQRLLVVLQVAMSTALIAGSWWMVRAVDQLGEPYERLRRDDLVTLQASIYSSRHGEDFAAAQLFWQRLMTELEALPEVESVAVAPVVGRWGRSGEAIIEGRGEPESKPAPTLAPLVSPGAFATLGLRPLTGRELRPEEALASDVVLVDRRFADSYLGAEPLGRRLRLGEDRPWRRVVGVMPNLASGETGESVPAVYLPALSVGGSSRTLVARTRPGAAEMELGIRLAVARVDPGATVYWVKTMRQWVELELRHVSRVHGVFVVFAGVAMLLTAAGLYGVLSMAVSRRRRELAVRQALGATAGELGRGVLASGLGQVGAGVAVGSVIAWWTVRMLAATFGGLASSTSVLAPTLLTLTLIGLLAAWGPALRVRAMDPITALKEE